MISATMAVMRLHCLLHSRLPGETFLPEWARRHGHEWTSTLVPDAPRLPTPEEADTLIVLGGPMSAWETERHPWLEAEKRLMEAFLAADRHVLGICLGAQLLAEVLGGRSYPGTHKEIGWHEIVTTTAFRSSPLGSTLPERFLSFLWHGDSFDTPPGALRIAGSAAFENQGFWAGRALALQFHLEARPEWVRALAERDEEELVAADFVQTAEQVLDRPAAQYGSGNDLLEGLLTAWLRE